MRNVFVNRKPERIDPGGPNVVRSEILVSDGLGSIRDINVLIDIQHTWVGDLVISLIGPRGARVLLVGSEGGGADNFRATILDDEAASDIEDARAPFRGVFRPEGSLADFDGRDPNGTWTLEIKDEAFADGGRLRLWAMEIETADPDRSAGLYLRPHRRGRCHERRRHLQPEPPALGPPAREGRQAAPHAGAS